MFWYRRRGTQAKRRKLVPWHGITSREPNTPRPHRTARHHTTRSSRTSPSTSQPAQSALSLSSLARGPAAPLLPPPEMDGSGSWDAIDWNQIEVRPSSFLLCPARYRPHPLPPLHPRACLCMRARALRSIFPTGSGAGARNSTRRARLQEQRPRPVSATSWALRVSCSRA
jgi:hypothetical protein